MGMLFAGEREERTQAGLSATVRLDRERSNQTLYRVRSI